MLAADRLDQFGMHWRPPDVDLHAELALGRLTAEATGATPIGHLNGRALARATRRGPQLAAAAGISRLPDKLAGAGSEITGQRRRPGAYDAQRSYRSAPGNPQLAGRRASWWLRCTGRRRGRYPVQIVVLRPAWPARAALRAHLTQPQLSQHLVDLTRKWDLSWARGSIRRSVSGAG